MFLSIAIESSNCLAYSSQLDKSLVINCCWTNLAPCESTTSSGRLCPLSVSCELLYTKFSNTPSSVAAIGNSLWCSCCDGVIYNVGNTSVIGHNAVSGTHKCTCELVSQIPLSVGLPMRKIDIRDPAPIRVSARFPKDFIPRSCNLTSDVAVINYNPFGWPIERRNAHDMSIP